MYHLNFIVISNEMQVLDSYFVVLPKAQCTADTFGDYRSKLEISHNVAKHHRFSLGNHMADITDGCDWSDSRSNYLYSQCKRRLISSRTTKRGQFLTHVLLRFLV
jgi:hypothetical protein